MDFGIAKSTWVTRRIPAGAQMSGIPVGRAVIGDVLACEVIVPSLHGRVETTDGRRSTLYPGDRIACVVGNRYATSTLEGRGRVSGEVIDLLSASGLCGEVVTRSDRAAKPTKLRVLGHAVHGDQPLNVRAYALPPAPVVDSPQPAWVVVVGSAMDSGKTTACASIVHGLRSAGYRVGAAKLTGTASSRDLMSFRDAGAGAVHDFLDMGWPSTDGCSASELMDIVGGLTGHLRASGVDVGVLEVADGLLQRETGLLLRAISDWLGPVSVVLAARESLAAVAGVAQLARMGHEPVAVTGVVTSSPLACQEVERAGAGPCVPTADIGRTLLAVLGVPTQRRVGAREAAAVG
jgi:hypothetical protein